MTHPPSPSDQELRNLAETNLKNSSDGGYIYNMLVEKCFSDCILHFRGHTLDEKEELCIFRCVEKTLNATQRIRKTTQKFEYEKSLAEEL